MADAVGGRDVPMCIVRFFDRIGGEFQRAIERRLRINTYETNGTTLIRHNGPFRRRSLELNLIVRWRVIPEMTFDIVDIELADGGSIRWLDRYDDLLSILHQAAGAKEVR